MRTFQIDYIIPNHGLRSSISNNKTDLTPIIDQVVSELRSACVNMPTLDYSVSWGELSSNTLASTWTYFRWGIDSWVPSNSFKVQFNPRFQWWDGPCGSKPGSYYDLKSTMIHEVLHGVGYMSTIDSNKTAWPSNFDLLLRDDTGERVVKDGRYTGNLGDRVYIDHIQMYNPRQYNSGSSFSHEDSSGFLMSHAQTRCTPHFDKNSRIILNRLGYGCSLNVTSFEANNDNRNTTLYIGIVAGFLVILMIGVVLCLCSNSKGRKKRNLEQQPLL
jgi:hypothetical protein